MRKFDYSFLNNGLLPANLVNLTFNIAALKTMAGVRKDEYTQIFTELEAVAKVQSIKSSNAIEGIVTSDERIAAIVNQNSAPLNHNEAEIAGYRDALNEIHLGYEHIDFRQSDILRLHETMMSFAGYEYGGQYKTDDNVILEIDADGNRRVRFRPTPASEAPKSMEQLELAYLDLSASASEYWINNYTAYVIRANGTSVSQIGKYVRIRGHYSDTTYSWGDCKIAWSPDTTNASNYTYLN